MDPSRLRAYDLDLDTVAEAVADANDAGSGSFLVHRSQELPIRALGRIHSTEDLGESVVARREAGTILLRDVGSAIVAPAPRIGAGSVNARPAVVLSVQKQPGADTLALTNRIDAELDALEASLGDSVSFERQIFRQALVDDAVIGVENIYKRLQRRAAGAELDAQTAETTVIAAAREVVVPIVYATLVVIVVFVPLFFLSGVEGRLLQPLGFAYVVAILGSLVVSLTVTPALYELVPPTERLLGLILRSKIDDHRRDVSVGRTDKELRHAARHRADRGDSVRRRPNGQLETSASGDEDAGATHLVDHLHRGAVRRRCHVCRPSSGLRPGP